MRLRDDRDMEERVIRIQRLNNANRLMLSRITGKHFQNEVSPYTSTSFNLVRSIRRRRLKWLGQILRKGEASDTGSTRDGQIGQLNDINHECTPTLRKSVQRQDIVDKICLKDQIIEHEIDNYLLFIAIYLSISLI